MPVRSLPASVDLHVHTRRHSPCAELLDPHALGPAMRERGLSGVVLAEHDALWDPEELAELRGGLGDDLRLYRGVEVSCAEGHVVVIGLDSLVGLEPGIAAADLVAAAHLDGAVAILAHPYQPVVGGAKRPELDRFPDTLDAVEVASSMTRGDFTQRAKRLAFRRGWAAVAGSDAHALEHLGDAYTRFPSLPISELHLARMITAGLGRPCIADARRGCG